MTSSAPRSIFAGDVDEALAHRARAAVVAFALLAMIVAWSTSIGPAPRLFAAWLVGGAITIGAVRLALRARRAHMSAPGFRSAFRGAAILAACFWGATAGFAITKHFDANALVMLVCTAGLAAGAVTSLSPDLPLCRGYVVLTIGPSLVAAAHSHRTPGYGTAAAIGAFGAFLWIQAGNQHRDFLSALHRNQLLEEARERAEKAERAAEAASAAKSEFLANMSHEIRTPMTAIIGYAELLLGHGLSGDERIGHAETIRRNGEHLLRLLNDILDVSKIEAGMLSVEALPCAPAEILADVESLMHARAVDRGLAFRVLLDTPIPRTIDADAMRIRQVLVNLVGNAVKFTERGSVTVRVRVDRSNAVDSRLVFDVADTGVGMNGAQIEALFAPFVQVDRCAARRHQGTGLGLYVSRRLARMMGGDVRVTSAPGRGSTFTFDLPAPANAFETSTSIRAPMPSAATAEASLELFGARVLLAEDGADNRLLITTILRRAGASVSVVEDGRAAVERAAAANAEGRPFEVVLMDMEMPLLDGYGATARLRDMGYRAPIVALTAHAMAESRERCVAAGCDDHVSKPFRASALIAAVAQRIGRSARPPPAASENLPPLLSTIAGDPDLADLLVMFCESLPDRVGAMECAAKNGDYPALSRLAHGIAGAGGSYGFAEITDVARRVEQAARDRSASAVRHVADLRTLSRRALAAHGAARAA